MSVIVVLKDGNRVLVGCDTRSSDNYSFIDGYVSSKKARHVDINKEIIIGAVRWDSYTRCCWETYRNT